MKNIGKYIFLGLSVAFAQAVFVAFIRDFLNGLSQVEASIVGVGLFLSFQMIICTGFIVSKLENRK